MVEAAAANPQAPAVDRMAAAVVARIASYLVVAAGQSSAGERSTVGVRAERQARMMMDCSRCRGSTKIGGVEASVEVEVESNGFAVAEAAGCSLRMPRPSGRRFGSVVLLADWPQGYNQPTVETTHSSAAAVEPAADVQIQGRANARKAVVMGLRSYAP